MPGQFAGPEQFTRGELDDKRHAFLSTDIASRSDNWMALAAVLISAIFFFAVVPFAKIPLAHVPSFIAAYQTALVICDLITAVLLLAQFNVLRSPALLVLASGYLFTALIALCHTLTYPDLFSATGLLGAGSQSTAWLYFFWHGGFPLFVIAYALLKDKGSSRSRKSSARGLTRWGTGAAILASVIMIVIVVCGLTFLATVGEGLLPVLMAGHRFSSPIIGIVQAFWLLSFLALIVLWWRRPHTVLDLWLMVVMCAWIFDLGLGAVFNTGRFDLGFYAGRIYGLLTSSFLLVVLLIETFRDVTRARNLMSEMRERSAAQVRLSKTTAELQRSNEELDSFAYAASHDLKAPLRGIRNLTEWITEDVKDKAGADTIENLALLANRVERLDMLLESLLQHSRIGRGGAAPEDIDIDQLIHEIADYIAPRSGFSVTYRGEIPMIHTSKAPLEQVLRNLIGNGLKHHDGVAGSVMVTARDIGNVIEFRVEDDGAGIPPQFHERIFQMFQTLRSRDELEGSGMGLAIVKKSVEGHGGTIRVESTPPHRGTAFIFTWEKERDAVAA